MIRALLLSVAWILGGASLAAALFWAFLNTPESTAFMLSLSLLLVLAIYAVVAITACGVMAGWAAGWQHPVHRRAIPGVLMVAVPVLFVVAVWWAVGQGLRWLSAHSGEIGAWFIATVNWSDVRPLLTGAGLIGEWLRWVAAPFAALMWLSGALAGRWQPHEGYAWLPRAPAPVRLLLATAIAAVTLWAPIVYGVYWRPVWLPATWVEPAVALVKFAVIALVGAIGVSLIIRLAVRSAPQG